MNGSLLALLQLYQVYGTTTTVAASAFTFLGTNFLPYCFKNTHRYASLYFCCCVEADDNELLTLEIIHRYVELLDKYFGSVSVKTE